MSKWREQKGVALLLTIVTISFLVAMTVLLIADVDQQLEEADLAVQDTIERNLLYSGLQLARAALFADLQENEFDSQLDRWAELDTSGMALVPGDVRLSVKVRDLTGLLQINSLVSQPLEGTKDERRKAEERASTKYSIWQRFLLSGKFAVEDEEQATEIIHALIDWQDADDESNEYGAETGYYLSMDPAYSSANEPLFVDDELLLVKGITPQLFFGNEEHEGIAPYITTRGTDGVININTAPAPVLLALNDELDQEMAESIIDFRNESDNQEALAQADWYTQLIDIPDDIVLPGELLSVQSTWFEVVVTVETSSGYGSAIGVIVRSEDGQVAVVEWHVQ